MPKAVQSGQTFKKKENKIRTKSQPTFASQPTRNSDQPLAEAAARELDKKKTRHDRVRLPQHTSVTRRKTVPDSSRPVPACDPIRSQLASVCN
ncbi:hypothetical protein F2Q68_00025855 [Brassica cretica]|uniref:Uncharacterized protein n=1 Tax=Brassica cretica TaxID=69181 RepID=A0A8S9ICG6_BRACR|nr:hypothetical protein F2Q68_00025855 [Brassica cretica]